MEHQYDHHLIETQAKLANDVTKSSSTQTTTTDKRTLVMVTGPVIVGAGPSGLAVAACLQSKGIPSLVLERSNCIASLWQLKTYDRLRLHLPKQFCELPLLPFPTHYPTYPTRLQFVNYLENYAAAFGIRPVFGRTVVKAEFDHLLGVWRVLTRSGDEEVEYGCKWLVVATGENAEVVMPEIDGVGEFGGEVMHSCQYRSGKEYEGKKVLVVGCGNSGMEVCLDLCHYNSLPSMVVRDTVHVLPREMMGKSTFTMSIWMLKWLPVTWVDQILLTMSRQVLGDTAELGLIRPKLGPLQLKNLTGKTPVLDVGTMEKIRAGVIKVRPAIRRLSRGTAEFVDGRTEEFDAVILATGYKSNVPYWLKGSDMFSAKDGFPKKSVPEGWKGECGLYAVGFARKGLPGATMDAKRIAEDVERNWRLMSR